MITPKNTLFITHVLLLSFFLISCSSDKEAKFKTPDSAGGTLELLVVTDNTDQWEGPIGDSVKAFFGQNISTLPQSEPIFTMANLEKSNFGKMFQAHHNILIITVEDEREEPFIETKRDLWAKPQRVIKMNLPTRESFFEAFDARKETFFDLFYEIEWERSQNTNMTAPDPDIKRNLIKSYQIGMDFPVGYHIAVKDKNFVWIRREAQKFSQGILIYFETYTDTNQFANDYIIKVRDSVTKKYIPGSLEGSYMTTSTSVVQPELKRTTLKERFAVETKGLWETKGDFMGGPFVSYTTVDEERQRIITVEGYVYAPNAEKRILLHQVDAIIRTLDF